MCLNIVGTEDYVKTTRSMNAVSDNLLSNDDKTCITSGSVGEGLEMRGSDLDIMFVEKGFEVYEHSKLHLNPNITYFSMDADDVSPGFTHLLLEHNRHPDALKYCEELNGRHYLSSTLYKRKFLSTEKNVIHGPCISDPHGLFDCAFCLHCTTWVSHATHWITRSNNSWPSHNVKEKIIKHGVLFVPIGIKDSPKEDFEWRISFSVAEKLLIYTFTHTQLICYVLMKILAKDVINNFSECKDLLSSYFLKTLIFWISEELPQSEWKPNNLIPCFMRCLRRLIYCVEYSVCLHYFIPENNMFEKKIGERARKTLLTKLYTLSGFGWRCILFSDQINDVHQSILNFPIEPNTFYLKEIEKSLNSKMLNTTKRYCDSWNANKHLHLSHRGKQKPASCENSFIQYVDAYHMSRSCSLHFQSKLHNNTYTSSDCKHQYKQFKFSLYTLLRIINHDALSGWLMVASLFYKAKQLTNSLQIIMNSTLKCSLSDMYLQLLKYKSLQRKNFVPGCKLFLADFVEFDKNSVLIPDALRIEGVDRPLMVSSSVYAYFLGFLCHYHCNNFRQCLSSLRNLHTVILENYLIEDQKLLASAYDLLGVALQILGDTESARQAFSMSVELYRCPVHNPASKRLLLLSEL